MTKDFEADKALFASMAERKKLGIDKIKDSLTYGELTFTSVAFAIKWIQKKFNAFQDGGVFTDLGSGSGKQLLTAAMVHTFRKIVGIECMQSVFEMSESLKRIHDETLGQSKLEVI